MDIVTTKKLDEKEIKIVRALQNYAENHGYSDDSLLSVKCYSIRNLQYCKFLSDSKEFFNFLLAKPYAFCYNNQCCEPFS